MKLEESILSKKSSGQSLIELIIAIGIFTAMVSALAFFVLNGYVSGRLSYEAMKAELLSKEAMEATKTIRDNNWEDLKEGDHALTIIDGKWVFDPNSTEEDISNYLTQGKRVISVENLDEDRRKITSKVTWQFSENRNEILSLVSHLTNWQKLSFEIRRPLAHVDSIPKRTTNPALAYDSKNGETFATTLYDTTKDPSIVFNTWEIPTMEYSALSLNYRYHADEAINDQYSVSYSLNGCTGIFITIIPFTSSFATDTTVSANIPNTQDLSKLCVKISTKRVGTRDGKNIYTRDIWTEGMP